VFKIRRALGSFIRYFQDDITEVELNDELKNMTFRDCKEQIREIEIEIEERKGSVIHCQKMIKKDKVKIIWLKNRLKQIKERRSNIKKFNK